LAGKRYAAEIAAEPQRGVGGDGAAAVEDIGDAAGRRAEIERQPVGAEVSRGEFALQEAAGRDCPNFCV
jgi:hypothetical protein